MTNEPAQAVETPQSVREEPTATSRGCVQYRDLIAQYDWDLDTALAVCQAESGGRADAHNPANYNGTDDKGLFQINSVHVGRLIGDEDRFNPELNVAAAYSIYLGSGWRAWSAFNNESYKKYL